MTLDEMERLARAHIAAVEDFIETSALRRKLESNLDTKLARAVRAMLPVIRAVEEWHIHGPGQSHCDEEGCRCTEQLLREAIDTMRAAIGEKP